MRWRRQLAEIFATDIDFRRELRKGDRFAVVYETLDADGEPSPGAGRPRAVRRVRQQAARPTQAIWFQDAGGKGGYYGLDGESMRARYLAARSSSRA